MNKEYLPYYDSLDEKYKQIYMEWSKEELIDHLVANIKNGEVLLSRIDKAIETIKDEGLVVAIKIINEKNDESLLSSKDLLIDILKGSDKE